MDSNENANIINLYFDSKEDRTLLMEELETKRTRREVLEEHVTVTGKWIFRPLFTVERHCEKYCQ